MNHNELNKNVHYDIDKEKDICQKISKFSDDKVSKSAITDKDKTDLSNSNDINGTSYKHKGSKDDIRRKQETIMVQPAPATILFHKRILK